MLTEIEVDDADVELAIQVLENERIQRIKHGDGDVDFLERILQALEEADRIVIR